MLPRLLAQRSCSALLLTATILLTTMGAGASLGAQSATLGPRFEIAYPHQIAASPLDGRLFLMVSSDASAEPRFQIQDGPQTQQIFGLDVVDWQPGTVQVIDAAVAGYPLGDLNQLPSGEYQVQVLFHRYETFRLANRKSVKLPMDRGEGQHWNRAPGNPYSTPLTWSHDTQDLRSISLVMDQVIAPIATPADTRYIKHLKMRSRLLSDFWGRDMELGAVVLLPHGFDDHPEARYPLMVNHGHFPYTFGGFRETPPDSDLQDDYSDRFKMAGYNRVQQEEAYALFQQWTAPDFPRFVVIQIQHANPYYDDSYAVNSANLGPYGDAIMYELIPYIEEQFRCLGEGWARFTYGGSTGGWEALAAQVFYPDEFNGCFAACPDPIDFRAYTVVDIYKDRNAYYLDSQWKRTPRPGRRDWLGHVSATLEEMNQRELVLGTHSRSGQQWDIWEAVYSPMGEDGYPQRIWDKRSGEIDAQVAAYWRENYDLRHIMQRDWKTLGPKLAGKIHLYCGTMDNYYLNNAVYLMEEFLESTSEPYYAGVVEYGDRAEHCWNGDHKNPNAISRLRYHTMYLPRILELIEANAPAGADLRSWRY